MSITYSKVNQTIQNHFFRKDAGEVALFFGETDLHAIAKNVNLHPDIFLSTLSSFLKNDWQIIVDTDSETFQGFGLIFLQTYAAYLMQKSDNYSENKYNNHLEGLLNIDTTALQKLFRTDLVDRGTIQDFLWKTAQNYLNQNGYFIDIPPARTGKGRYVQYPLSQSLLNTEDLKFLTPWFDSAGLSIYSRIGLKDFTLLIQQSHSVLTNHWTSHAKKVLNKFSHQKQRIYKQIFNFYQNWDGKVYQQNKETGSLEEVKKTQNSKDFLLKKQENNLKLYSDLYSDNPVEIEINPDVLKLLSKTKGASRIAIFTSLDSYENEFELTNKIEIGEQAIILLNQYTSPNEFAYLQKEASCKFLISYGALYCYELILDENLKNSFLRNFIRDYPFRITGGLKISRKTWLQGCGPILQINSDCELRINERLLRFEGGERFSLCDFPPERYLIKVKDYSSSVFFIEPAKNNCTVSISERNGWSVENWELDSINHNIQGLRFSSNVAEISNIRSWINLQTNHKKSNQSSIVLKALKRTKSMKYGK